MRRFLGWERFLLAGWMSRLEQVCDSWRRGGLAGTASGACAAPWATPLGPASENRPDGAREINGKWLERGRVFRPKPCVRCRVVADVRTAVTCPPDCPPDCPERTPAQHGGLVGWARRVPSLGLAAGCALCRDLIRVTWVCLQDALYTDSGGVGWGYRLCRGRGPGRASENHAVWLECRAVRSRVRGMKTVMCKASADQSHWLGSAKRDEYHLMRSNYQEGA